MSRPRAVLLVNPAARHAERANDPALLATLGQRWTIDVVVPDDAAASTRVAATAAAGGVDAVIAAGGDGTAAAAARGLAGTTTPLGLLPLGTANDLARVLGLRHAPLDAAARLVASRTRPMDLVAVDDTTFCTVGGVGIVCDSAMAAARLKTGRGRTARAARALGGSIYRATAVAALLTRRPLSSGVEIEYETPAGEAGSMALASPGLFVANQRMCGGGIALPGISADDDGAVELLVIRDVSRPRLVAAFTRLTLGAPIPDSVLTTIRVRSARIRCERSEKFLGDGDAIGEGRTFDVRAMPHALRILAPR